MGSDDVVLDADVCKAHVGNHGSRIRAEFSRRCAALRDPDSGEAFPPISLHRLETEEQ